MQHPCAMVNPAQQFVTWKYPDHLPSEPFFMVYHPCICGHEIRVETVTVHSYMGRGLQAAQYGRIDNYANEALANHLARNYQYPPQNHDDDEDDEDEDEDETDDQPIHHQIYENRENRPDWRLPRRQPNLLAPVFERLVYPEYPEEHGPLENWGMQNLSIAQREYLEKNRPNVEEESEVER